MSSDERKAFLQFTTGCSTLPPGGLANLHPRLTVVRKVCFLQVTFSKQLVWHLNVALAAVRKIIGGFFLFGWLFFLIFFPFLIDVAVPSFRYYPVFQVHSLTSHLLRKDLMCV